MNRAISGIASVALFLGSCRVALATTPLYHLTDLGTLVGGDLEQFHASYAYGINNHGQVVGYSGTLQSGDHAFLYQNGSMQDLGTLGNASYAYGINDSGQIAGYNLYPSSTVPINRGFLYQNGAMQDIGSLDGGTSYAFAINGSGQIVGMSSITPRRFPLAVVYQNGSMEALPPLATVAGIATGINNLGDIVGAYQNTPDFLWHAYVDQNGVLDDLGTLSGTRGGFSYANSINDSGQIVGWTDTTSDTSGPTHAFLYADGAMQDLGTLGGDDCGAFDINDSGQIVGWSSVAGNSQYRDAFLYQNGSMLDLNDLLDGSGSGWEIQQLNDGEHIFNLAPDPIAINDAGQIAVTAMNSRGVPHAVLLTPVPEPSSLALLAGAVLACASRRRRRAEGAPRHRLRYGPID